jgi:hypothetical protein
MELAREKPGSDIGAPLSRGTTAAIEAASIATQPQPQSQSRTEKHFRGRGHHRRHQARTAAAVLRRVSGERNAAGDGASDAGAQNRRDYFDRLERKEPGSTPNI